MKQCSLFVCFFAFLLTFKVHATIDPDVLTKYGASPPRHSPSQFLSPTVTTRDPWRCNMQQPKSITNADIDRNFPANTVQQQNVADAEAKFRTTVQQWLDAHESFEPQALQNLIMRGQVLAEQTKPEQDLDVAFFDVLVILHAKQDHRLAHFYNEHTRKLHSCYRIIIEDYKQAQSFELGFRFSWAMFQHQDWPFSERDHLSYSMCLQEHKDDDAARQYLEKLPASMRTSQNIQREISRLTPVTSPTTPSSLLNSLRSTGTLVLAIVRLRRTS